jgi:peptidoglycan hydrolase CwlO-like protein
MVIFVVYFFTASQRKIAEAEASTVDRAYVEQLLQDILQDNTDIKAELSDIQEKVSSIEKMMKDV